MSNIVTLKERPDIQKIIRAVAPKYRKHKAVLDEHTKGVYPTGTYWDGGSVSSYFHVKVSKLGGYLVSPVPAPTAPPQFGGGEPKPFAIPAGDAVVKLGTFRGKPSYATVYLNN